jgi:hypothetical protein
MSLKSQPTEKWEIKHAGGIFQTVLSNCGGRMITTSNIMIKGSIRNYI